MEALLVGAITNRWTVQLQPAWRYQFARNLSNRSSYIADTQSAKTWAIASKEDGSTGGALPCPAPAHKTHVAVARRLHPDLPHYSETGGLILAAAGLKQFGTEAAAHLLTDSEQFGAVLRQLPAGWETRNMQLVFHARVIGNTPAHLVIPDIL